MNPITTTGSHLRAFICLAALILVTACGTTREVKDLVAESNAALLLNEIDRVTVDVEAPSGIATPGLVERGSRNEATDDEAVSIITRIDNFIESHPTLAATNNALRIRKAMLHLNKGQSNLARAAFESFDSGVPGNTRDLALYQARDAIVFWWPVAGAKLDNLPGDALFEQRIKGLAEVIDAQPRGSSVRLFLAYLHSHMTLKRSMNMDEVPGAKALEDAFARLIQEFDADAQTGIKALFNPTSTAADLAKLPEPQIRFLTQLPALKRFYVRTWKRVSGNNTSPTPIDTMAPWIPQQPPEPGHLHENPNTSPTSRCSDKGDMSISSITSSALSNAYTRFEHSSESLVKNGPNAKDIVELKSAEKSVEVAAKVLKVEDGLQDTLLDILA